MSHRAALKSARSREMMIRLIVAVVLGHARLDYEEVRGSLDTAISVLRRLRCLVQLVFSLSMHC